MWCESVRLEIIDMTKYKKSLDTISNVSDCAWIIPSGHSWYYLIVIWTFEERRI
jgi:hypothetical protein